MTQTLRVFISSTWQDLIAEREAVEKALHRMPDIDFIGMEYTGSRPETPQQVSLADVDRSDIYIGIFGRRYGSGITEDEYRRARERNLPCLIYRKDPSIPVDPAYIEQDPAGIAKMEALTRDLLANHTSALFRSPDHLASQVATDLFSLISRLRSQPNQAASQAPQSAPKTADELHKALLQRFNLEELRTLCFELGVDYEDLGGEGRQGKTRELVLYMRRRNQLDRLIRYVNENT